jgi:RimJ/RimL family protein N-acetyltransferase
VDPLFQTRRLVIRRFEHGDIPDILDLTSHPSVFRETVNIPRTAEELVGYVETQAELQLFAAKTCVDLAVERHADGKVIGLLSVVSNGERQAEIGWGFAIHSRGQGYATEAAHGLITFLFEEHGYHRLFAGTIFTNKRSWKLMERLGMRKEAHFVEAHVPAQAGGPWIDTVRYAVLAEEWPRESDRS